MSRFIAAAVMATWLGLSPPAMAQSDANRAAAQTLFDEAQALKKDGKLDAACDKFQKSQRLDPAVGTQLNLADCYETVGKTASAWVNYVEVSQLSDSDARRAKFAKERADALKPRLTYLRVDVATPGTSVTRNGVEVPEATWGTAVPIDPGAYEIIARGAGKLPWRKEIDVEGEGAEIELKIPALSAAAVDDVEDDPPVRAEPDDDDDGGVSGQFVAGVVIGAVGLVGIGVGAAFAGIAHGKAAESEDHCLPADPNQCNADGVALRDEAQTGQTVYAVSFAVGGAAAVVGLVMILTAPSGDEADDVSVVPIIGPEMAGVSLLGRF